ncbi:DUF4004 family protein [Bacillus sp. AK128]
MNEELLSKKELLEHTSISYGQLYRWKRMDLIPESWFIKKSSFTGQETYFPKGKILERIQKIIELKDAYSLEELAAFFSPNPSEVNVSFTDLREVLKEDTINYFQSINSELKAPSFHEIFYLYLCEKIEVKHKLEIKGLFQELTFLKEIDFSKHPTAFDLVALQKEDEIVWMLTPSESPLIIQHQASIHLKISLIDYLNELKIILSNLNL